MTAEFTSRYGRKVKATVRMKEFLESADRGVTAKKRAEIAKAAESIGVKVDHPAAMVDIIQPLYKKFVEEQTILLDQQDQEITDLDEEEKTAYYEYYAPELSLIEKNNDAVKNYLVKNTSPPKLKPKKAGSTRSTSSRRSRTEDAVIAERTRVAILEAEFHAAQSQARLEQERRALEQASREIENKEKLLKLETELKISAAKLRAMEEEDNGSVASMSTRGSSAASRVLSLHDSLPGYKPPPRTPLLTMPQNRLLESTRRDPPRGSTQPGRGFEESLERILEKVATSVSQSGRNLVQVEPKMFGGDILAYSEWLQNIEELVEKDIKPERRFLYLSRYVEGEAKECISSFSKLEPITAYKEAITALNDRYGDANETYEAIKAKLHEWPALKEGDGPSIRRFSDFLNSVLASMPQFPSLTILNEASENQILLEKLPKRLVDKWSYIVEDWSTKNKKKAGTSCFPPFVTFTDFLRKEARVECGPIKRAYKARCEQAKKSIKVYSTDVAGDHYHDSEEDVCEATVNSSSAGVGECPLCKGQHLLTGCPKFASLSFDSRSHFLRTERRCRRCLEQGHISRGCLSTITCATCHRHHHTLLHDEQFESKMGRGQHGDHRGRREGPATVHSINVGSEDVALIIPMRIGYAGSPDLSKVVYGLLDSQSNACFMTDEIATALQTSGSAVNLKLQTMAGSEEIEVVRVNGLMLQHVNGGEWYKMPRTYVRDTISADYSQIPTVEQVKKWPHLRGISGELADLDESIPIGLLLGRNCPAAVKPVELIPGELEDPYAVKTRLGWGVVGNLTESPNDSTNSLGCWTYSTEVMEETPKDLIKLLAMDFCESKDEEAYSIDEKRFLTIMEENLKFLPDGHVELPLPLKDEVPIPNNSKQALNSTLRMKSRFLRDKEYLEQFTTFMESLIEMGFAEVAPTMSAEERSWWLSYHGVKHPEKPGQVRGVFHGHVPYKGYVLNQHLLSGPDLSNNMVGVFARFRKEPVAITCDVEKMFCQVRVPPSDRDLMRYYWWPKGDLSQEPVEYRLLVHIFGLTSSPGVANYGFKAAADRGASEFGEEAQKFLKDDFYVDDGVTAKEESSEVIRLVDASHGLCRSGGFNLTKFLSNKEEVIAAIPPELRAKGIQEVNLEIHGLPTAKSLGTIWSISRDCFIYKVTFKKMEITRRGMLSEVSAVFDPLGLVSPVILKGRRILQDVCRNQKTWDEPLEGEYRERWETWKEEAVELHRIEIPRCYKPAGFGRVTQVELHHFSDASIVGYGECSYVRLFNQEGRICTALVMAKARVTPVKPVTIPRLELTAAVVAAKMSRFLTKQLKYENPKHFFWTDSKVVLGYLTNTKKRYHTFVANRVQTIRDLTDVESWRYVDTNENPADLASRGATPAELLETPLWYYGPTFLRTGVSLPEFRTEPLPPDDPEIHGAQVFSIKITDSWSHQMEKKTERFSSWHRLCLAIAVIHRAQRQIVARRDNGKSCFAAISADDLKSAAEELVQISQTLHFEEVVTTLRQGGPIPSGRQTKHKAIYKLDPFLDDKGTIRVGGRLEHAEMPYEERHPVLVHKKSWIAVLLTREAHERIGHGGREFTLADLRTHGIWINAPRSLVAGCLWKCVVCIKLRGQVIPQKMADLPADRLLPAPPFQKCGIDLFGPFLSKQGRSLKKRWGVAVICLASTAVHLEVAAGLETSDFLNVLRRVIARRGNVEEIRCDCGTNFVGANHELQSVFRKVDQDEVQCYLKKQRCNYIKFEFNTPHSSYKGGFWERRIRCFRETFAALLTQHKGALDDDGYHTLFCEVECIHNSRPVTIVDQNDGSSLVPLAPNMLLTMRPNVYPGTFGRSEPLDIYARNRWRRVQMLADEFWSRWRTELLPKLQSRSKWLEKRRAYVVDDVVLAMEDGCARGAWPLAVVTAVKPSPDQIPRSVTIKMKDKTYERPVHKLLLLVPRVSLSESLSTDDD